MFLAAVNMDVFGPETPPFIQWNVQIMQGKKVKILMCPNSDMFSLYDRKRWLIICAVENIVVLKPYIGGSHDLIVT